MVAERRNEPMATEGIPDCYEEYVRAAARRSFPFFRRYIRPDMKWGWWVEEVADELQCFYRDWISGLRPKLALEAPPQHGKSSTMDDFIAWVAGKDPDKKTIFGSYSDELGKRTNINLQRMWKSERYRGVFPSMRIDIPGWQCNDSLIEYAFQKGSFRNTTVNGQINGQELHLGVIDDPVKGSKEAASKPTRDHTWTWFTDDFMTRSAADSALLIIMTRWHVDDLLGRFVERFPDVKVLRYPAIAEQDEQHRRAGEALFPQHKPLDILYERRKTLTKASWEALYQQNPLIVGGGIFPINKLVVLSTFDRSKIKYSVRAWDKSATHGGGDYTAGVLMHEMKDGTFVIEHVVRGQWSALEREEQIKATAAKDGESIDIVIEQEPGSSGKESFEATARNLAGYCVYADKVTGSKEVRAEPFAAQVQAGNVWLAAGPYVEAFLDEMEVFPSGLHDDQIDAAAMAFARLTNRLAYLTDYDKWL
jgi:predicted phage terminase large subunit-like protein